MRLCFWLLGLAGCVTGQYDAARRSVCAGDVCYRVGELPDFRLVRRSGAEIAFFNDREGAVAQANATCRDDAEAASLEVLMRHLLIGYTETQDRAVETVQLDGREALHRVVDAKLDGVPVVLDLYVLKRNGCIFDLSLASPPDKYDAVASNFTRFVAGFAQMEKVVSAGGVARLGRLTTDGVSWLGAVTLTITRASARAFRRPFLGREYIYQTLQVGVRSLPLAFTMSAFAGMVMALQFGYGLERFGAKLYIGQTTATAICRELGPILTALVVGARVGAGIAAELGGMAVTEQIDAVRALGADPLQRLVAPRLFGVVVGLPILTVLSDLVGLSGSMLVARLQYGVSPRLYLRGAYDFLTIGDFTSGVAKAVAFAFVIGGVSCTAGLGARGGTEGVGRAATSAVVWGALGVLATDVLLTKLLLTA